MYGVRLIEALPRWLYRLQPAFPCMVILAIPLWGRAGFGGLVSFLTMALLLLPGHVLFWLLSWLAVTRSPEKRLGFSTLPFSVYLLTMPTFYVVLPDVGFDGPDGDLPSAAMRLASVMGLQFDRLLSYELARVFGKVMLVSGALALLAALADIVRGKIDRAFDKAVAGSRQPAQRGGKNERPEVETAPTSTGAAPPSTGVAPQDPSACG